MAFGTEFKHLVLVGAVRALPVAVTPETAWNACLVVIAGEKFSQVAVRVTGGAYNVRQIGTLRRRLTGRRPIDVETRIVSPTGEKLSDVDHGRIFRLNLYP